MRAREFPAVSVQRGDDGRRQSGAAIVCGDCGARDVVINATRYQHMPPVSVGKKLAQQGWYVASSPSGDRCPACLAARRRARPTLQVITGAAAGEHHEQNQEEASTMTTTAPKLVPPAPKQVVDVTIDQKRRINAKLHEVWDGGQTGYSRGWSDHAVAEALNVPRAAVAQIRSEFFGEARDNPEVREFLERADILFDAAAQIEAKVSALVAEAKTLSAGIEVMRRDVGAIRKTVGAA